MEEKNISAQFEDDELLIEEDLEEDLEEEEQDDEADLVEDEEEYDFNDEEDIDDEDTEEDTADSENAEENTEEEELPAEEQAEEKPADATNENGEMRATMVKLLNKLGYHGTYEEAMAAYEADEAQKVNEGTEQEEPEKPKTVNYTEMAETSLRDINAAFGTEYTDFSKFDNLPRFATLVMGGATAIEAYRATQKQFVSNPTEEKDEEQIVGKPSKGHLKALPAAGAGEGGASYADRQALASLKELYPERSTKDLRKMLDRVKRARA